MLKKIILCIPIIFVLLVTSCSAKKDNNDYSLDYFKNNVVYASTYSPYGTYVPDQNTSGNFSCIAFSSNGYAYTGIFKLIDDKVIMIKDKQKYKYSIKNDIVFFDSLFFQINDGYLMLERGFFYFKTNVNVSDSELESLSYIEGAF